MTGAVLLALVLAHISTGARAAGDAASPLDQTRAQADMAWAYLEQDQPAAALEAFRKLGHDRPVDARTRLGLAEAMRLSGDAAGAEVEYMALINIPEVRSRALEGLGLARLRHGDRRGALEPLLTATDEDRRAWRAWLGLAQLRDLDHAWNEADAAYAGALEASDKPQLVYNNHGISMLARGEFGKSVALFRKALQLDQGFEQARINLELANARVDGAYATAAADPDVRSEARRLNNIGYVAMLKGDLGRAEANFERALEVSPSFYLIAYRNLQVVKSLQLAAGAGTSPGPASVRPE